MNNIANQFRRIFADDGRGDKDFAKQEEKLRQAQQYLKEAADGLTKAANILSDLIRSRA
jgi:hypothetical protein